MALASDLDLASFIKDHCTDNITAYQYISKLVPCRNVFCDSCATAMTMVKTKNKRFKELEVFRCITCGKLKSAGNGCLFVS